MPPTYVFNISIKIANVSYVGQEVTQIEVVKIIA